MLKCITAFAYFIKIQQIILQHLKIVTQMILVLPEVHTWCISICPSEVSFGAPYLIRVLVMQCKTSKIHSYLSKNRWVWFSNIRSNGNWPKNLETKPSAYFSNRFCKCPRMYIIYIVNIILIWIQTVHILYINIQTVVKTRVYPIKNYKSDQVPLPNTKTSNTAQNPNIMLQC